MFLFEKYLFETFTSSLWNARDAYDSFLFSLSMCMYKFIYFIFISFFSSTIIIIQHSFRDRVMLNDKNPRKNRKLNSIAFFMWYYFMFIIICVSLLKLNVELSPQKLNASYINFYDFASLLGLVQSILFHITTQFLWKRENE